MDNREKMEMMDKFIRELEDLTNSQTSVLKKIGQIEAENINLGNKVLEKRLPDIYEHAEQTLTEATTLQTEFTEARDKFVKDNKLDVVEEPAE
ncbi:MAG: hypothetical protein ACR2KB_09535 [Chitinophagaceae bacterium]|jgi:ElaB/YqjD/DUF883 family membrane-anchored ribosome-binding protein|nr:hypothetical protein [Flavisolibacter sp.]